MEVRARWTDNRLQFTGDAENSPTQITAPALNSIHLQGTELVLIMKSKFSFPLLGTVISTILFYLLMKYPFGTEIGIIGATVFAAISFAVTMLISRLWLHTKISS